MIIAVKDLQTKTPEQSIDYTGVYYLISVTSKGLKPLTFRTGI